MSPFFQPHWFCITTIIPLIVLSIHGEQDSIHKKLTKCELEALKLGTDMSDVINSPIGSESWAERVNQDFIAEQLGFAHFISKGVRGSGLTFTGSNSTELRVKGNWSWKSVEDSAYHVLNHKWVYMFGDSTTRQVWSSFAAPFQGNNFERNAKEWTRGNVSHRMLFVGMHDSISANQFHALICVDISQVKLSYKCYRESDLLL